MTLKYNDLNIFITDSVLNSLSKFKQFGNQSEKGGILLGSVFDNKIEINKISIPTLFDKSSKYGFIRDKKSAKLYIDYEFLNSEGKIIYLGEWHTHPEDYPIPSNQDKKMIAEQFKKNIINEDCVFMVIVGRKDNYMGVFNGKKLIKL